MTSPRSYLPITIIAIFVLLLAGCSGGGGGKDPGLGEIPVDPGANDPIDCLFGGEGCEEEPSPDPDPDPDPENITTCEDPNEEYKGGMCKCKDGYSEVDGSCQEDEAVIAPLKVLSDKFEKGKYNESYECETALRVLGGVEPYTFVVSGLPQGMTFNEVTKRITGTPTEVGIFPLVFSVTDAEGIVAELKQDLVVQDEYEVELRYNGKGINEALEELDDEIIPFNDRSLSVHIVDGHASTYTWTIEIDGKKTGVEKSKDLKSVSFDLPDDDSGEEKEFLVKISVVDNSGRKQEKEISLKRGLDPCTVPIEVTSNGGVLSALGGKAPYVWSVEVNSTVDLYNHDDESVSGSKASILIADLDEAWGAGVLEANNVAVSVGKELISISKGETEDNGYAVVVHRVSGMSGIRGYAISGAAKVEDQCGNISEPATFLIEKKRSMDTLDKLEMVCDFEDINDAGDYNAYLEFDFYTEDGAVARVHYDLAPCNHNERACENSRSVEALGDGDDEDFNLSEIELSDVVNIKLRKHKKTYFGPCSDGDLGKLDVDLQWCRFYTDNLFAIWDDQKNGDDLNDNEVSGNKHNLSNDSTRKTFIIDRFEGYEENGSIWFMNDMLESFSVGSEDGFDYVTIKNNDGKD